MLVFSKIILLWLNAKTFKEQYPDFLSRTPIEESLAAINSFKSSGDINNGQSLLHSFWFEKGQVLLIISIPPMQVVIVRH